MVWGPEDEQKRRAEMRPFEVKNFVLVPKYDSESVRYRHNECEAILLGSTGIVLTDYAEDESNFSLLHRTLEGDLLAVSYLALGYPIQISFAEEADAQEFLNHLKKCPALKRADAKYFVQSKFDEVEPEQEENFEIGFY